jgi:hypothetical protein
MEPTPSSELTPRQDVTRLVRQVEMLAMQQKKAGDIEFSSLSDAHKDKVLDILSKHEDNLSGFHAKRMDKEERVELKYIEADTIEQRNQRYIVLSLISFVAIITVLILFLKDVYFEKWVTFLFGLIGGFGIGQSKLVKNISSSRTSRKEKHQEEADEDE